MDQLITLAEAARQIGIKEYQARQYVRSRQLKALQAGRSFVIRVKQSEVDRFRREIQKGVAV